MARMVALLRGINVGGNTKVPMAALRDLLTEHGYADVVTLLNSGNVVFSSSLKPVAVEAEVEEIVRQSFGFTVKVVVRSGAQMKAVVKNEPFGEVAHDPSKHVVVFLSALPAAAVWKALSVEAEPFAPEKFELVGRELYMWCPNGIGRSKLAQFMVDRKLGVVATGRNWNTVLKLADLI